MTVDDRIRFGARLVVVDGSAMQARYAERSSAAALARLKRALRPPLPLVHNPAEPRLPAPPGSANLYIGGGGRETPGFINLDIGFFAGVNIVANAERLPFRDAVLDGVECDAVLEHVEDPDRLACEMLRVLKPGGRVHVVVPFCHPYHAYPADHRRWTEAGLRQWLERMGFRSLQSGVRTGPTATLLAFLLEYTKVLFGTGKAGKAAWALSGWLLFPLRYVDLWLNRGGRAHLLANHVYALAAKPYQGSPT
jgi:SAM-dependent methyltransferase